MRKWDYRHQVLGQKWMTRRQIFVAVKWMELRFHLRPRKMWSILRTRDPFMRRQLLWTLRHCGAVWLAEVAEFLLPRRRARLIGRAAPSAKVSEPFPRALPVLDR